MRPSKRRFLRYRCRRTRLAGQLSSRLALAATLVLTACGQNEPQRTPDRAPTTLRPAFGDFENRVLLAGVLEATESIAITAPRTPSWQVQVRWMVEDGATVKAGDKVVELDNTSFTADLEEKRLKARKDEKEIQRLRAQAEAQASDKRFQVEQRLTELDKAKIQAAIPKDLIPLREHQESQLALEKAQTAYETALDDLETHVSTQKSEINIRRLAYEQTLNEIRIAERSIEALTIEAPRDGVVIIGAMRWEGRKVQVGDNVWPGFVILRIPDLSEMEVVAHLSDVDDGQLATGMNAKITLESYPDREFTGTIHDITPVAQELSPRSLRRAFRVRTSIQPADPSTMRPGMAARIEVTAESLKDVWTIPRAALRFSNEQSEARGAHGNWVPLELGPCNATHCVVESPSLNEEDSFLPAKVAAK